MGSFTSGAQKQSAARADTYMSSVMDDDHIPNGWEVPGEVNDIVSSRRWRRPLQCSIIGAWVPPREGMDMKRALVWPALALSFGVSAEPLDAESLAEWLQRYEQAWESRDAQAVRDIFTEDALYYETPYSEPFSGREGVAEYWAQVTADQRDIDFESDVIAVNGNVGVAHWTASFTSASTGDELELNGVFVLRFDEQNLVSELREWWMLPP